MVILITGASHTGKTLLAQRMLEVYGFPYLSIDHLKMGLIRSGQTELTPYYDSELTEYLWPIVCEIIKTAIENEQNLIVEGCYVPFDWRKSFDEDYLRSIRFICLAMSDDYIDCFFDDIAIHASEIEKRLFDDCSIELLKSDNRRFADGFTSAGEAVTLINAHDIHMDVLNKLINNTKQTGEKTMLTVYGSPLCPDCRECEANFKAHGIDYIAVDINESMKNLKEFLKLRDSLPVFDKCRELGSIGIPALMREDGTVTLDWEGYLSEMGLAVVFKDERPFCSIDGKNC